MKKAYGTRELIKCLKKLGFREATISASHQKFYPPKNHQIPQGLRPYIIVQLGRKSYPKHSRHRYISQIARLGFDKKKILKLL